MHRGIIAAVLALLAVTAGCVGAAQPNVAAQEGDAPSGPSISVSASGQVETAPDLAVVNLAVVARAETADEARQQVADAVAEMRDALRDAGVPDDAVQTTGFLINIEYDYSEREREIIGYRAVHSFRVESAPDDAGMVIDTAVSNGATDVNGVQFTLSDEREQALRGEAIALAMANARSDADAVASAGDLTVTGIRTASTSGAGFGPVPYYDERVSADGASGAPTVLEPGTVTVTATVNVVYEAS